MTTQRDIIIHQGQAFALSLDYAGTAGRGQRMHIRLADSTATVVQILTHNGDANARVLFDGTSALDITIGASVSAAWVVLADRVEWVYDIEDYDLADEDDCVIPYRGKVIVRGNRTRASDVTPSEQMPSGDGRYVRFDTDAQGLSDAQKLAARTNIGAGTGSGGGGSGDVVGPASATDDRIAAFDGVTGKLIKQGSVTATAVASHLGSTSNPHSVTAAQVGADATGTAAAAVSAHAGAVDPHGDRAYADVGLALKAPIASPTFTGVPAAPTASGGTNTTQVATTAFVTSAVASAVAGLLEFIGNVDASTNPNYSAASKGDSYLISVAGKIGGASGKSVEAGDLVVASADNAGGTEASVGTSWFVLEHNLAGALLTANALSELSGVAATARSNLGLVIGTNVQAYDADLTTWAGITPGIGVGTALAVNTGSAGAFVVNGGALGTPSSGTLTNAAGLPLSTGVTGQLPLANGGTGANLTDPNADRLMFWDESASAVAFLTPGTGLTITGTTIDASASITGFTAAESTASPNATVSVASLTANNAATNVDAALCPKGTGAVLADVPDSTATGGNKRGASAVDWQTVRSAAAQVASGTKATVAGGENNTASGTQSVVGGGNGNTAVGITATIAGGGANWARSNNSTVGGGSSNDVTGVNATVAGGSSNNTTANYATVAGGELNTGSGAYSWSPGGWNSTTRGIHGAGAYAAGKRSAQGDRQTMVLPISCAARTDATATVMTSDAGVASATNQMVLPNNSSMFFEVDVVAHDTTLKSASWKVQGTIRRGANAAATAIVGTNVTTTFGSDLSGGSPGVTCTADTTNGALQVTFTGIAATTIYPSGHIRTVIAA